MESGARSDNEFSSSDSTVAVLLVCRNRRETTLKALRSLANAPDDLTLTAVLFDDASSDGTVEAVLAEFPEVVVVQGDGNAFWNGGLHQAWIRALPLNVSAFLWLNDDVQLDVDALDRLIASRRQMMMERPDNHYILVGATRGDDGRTTYSGQRRERSAFALRFRKVPPTTMLQPVDTFNGNIVLIPRAVVDLIGINDASFHHNMGDIDYGLRATTAGVSVRLLPGTLGVCSLNEAKASYGYGSPRLSLAGQWRKVNSLHGLPPRNWWRLTRRHSGIWFPIHFLLPYRWLLLPRRGAR